MQCSQILVVIVAVLVGTVYMSMPPDLLTGISSDLVLTGWQLQLAVAGFCVSPVPDILLKEDRGRDTGGDFEFKDDGDIGALLLGAHSLRPRSYRNNM